MTESVKATQIAPEEITKKDVTKAYLRWQARKQPRRRTNV